MGAISVVVVLALVRLDYSRFGLAAARSARPTSSRRLGVCVFRYKLAAFVLGSFMAGLTGAFFAHSHQVLQAGDFGLEPMVLLVVFTVIGGAGSVWGPVIGTIALTVAAEFMRELHHYEILLFGTVLILTTLLLPQGLVALPGWLVRVVQDRGRRTAPWEPGVLLELRRVSRRFGGLQAVADLSMAVRPGSIHGLIGPNGAGKSTVFNLISGVVPLSAGEVLFRGERISGLRPSEICRRGVARTFQATTLFREYTVFQNLLVAVHLRAADGLWPALGASPTYRRKEERAVAHARDTPRILRARGPGPSPAAATFRTGTRRR